MRKTLMLFVMGMLALGATSVFATAECGGRDEDTAVTAKTLDSLTPNARRWMEAAMRAMDGCWDEKPALMGGCIRETAFYAVGLLLRNGEGDLDRALRAIETVVKNQHDAPGKPYHGTFGRGTSEVESAARSPDFEGYDKNWREFVGTTLAFILEEYGHRLPESLVEKVETALAKAAEGAHRRSVRAGYTNISLMSAFLLDYAGRRLNVPEWKEHGEQLATEIYENFRHDNTFTEYNSPTYCGVDLYALAEWRSYALSPKLRKMGRYMEAELWRDIGRLYHAGMKNLCGPYDRTNRMDMRKHVSLCGMWIASVVDEEFAPMPDIELLSQPGAFRGDFCAMTYIAVLGAEVPADVMPHLTAFIEERQLEREIAPPPLRVATAWLSEDLMIGAQHTGGKRRGSRQFHPATIHWKTPDGDVGWVRLKCSAAVDATASERKLCISFRITEPTETCLFQVFAPGVEPAMMGPARWSLPGLTLKVETNAREPAVTGEKEFVQLAYPVSELGEGKIVTFTFRAQ